MMCRACGKEERASEGYPVLRLRPLHLQHVQHARRRRCAPTCTRRAGVTPAKAPAAGT